MKQSLFCLFLLTPLCGLAQLTSQNDERLKEGLRKFPLADSDKDGVLTLTEAMAYLAERKKKEKNTTQPPKPGVLQPDVRDVAYGAHERCRLDLYLAKSPPGPMPLVVMIHGGGFRNGDKSRWAADKTTRELLAKGISCAAVNYPFLEHMPVQDILKQCARAVQFLRSRAGEWNIDKRRFASMGGSAGAGTSLWLATRDDLADPAASDPVLHQSTRLSCAVCNATQATYDVSRWESFLGRPGPEVRTSEAEAAHFYHLPSVEAFKTEQGRAILKECDMLSWISKDDPPLYLSNPQVVEAPSNRGEWLHCIQHAREVGRECKASEVKCIVLQDQPEPKPGVVDFLTQHLLGRTL
jgi:acetyl esterase